jgi:hypothetical protein
VDLICLRNDVLKCWRSKSSRCHRGRLSREGADDAGIIRGLAVDDRPVGGGGLRFSEPDEVD